MSPSFPPGSLSSANLSTSGTEEFPLTVRDTTLYLSSNPFPRHLC